MLCVQHGDSLHPASPTKHAELGKVAICLTLAMLLQQWYQFKFAKSRLRVAMEVRTPRCRPDQGPVVPAPREGQMPVCCTACATSRSRSSTDDMLH